MSGRGGEIIVDYVSPDGEHITHIRSTLITSSIQTLRELGFLERYLRVLPRSHRDALLAPRAPGWLPVEEAAIHYNACNEMALSQPDLDRISESVVTTMTTMLLSTFRRNASRSTDGATPWLSLGQAGRLFSRMNVGGAIRVTRRAADEALVEVRGGSLYSIPYYEFGHCAMLRVQVQLFAKKVQVRTLSIAEREHRALINWS
jgi:hypothetical protein